MRVVSLLKAIHGKTATSLFTFISLVGDDAVMNVFLLLLQEMVTGRVQCV